MSAVGAGIWSAVQTKRIDSEFYVLYTCYILSANAITYTVICCGAILCCIYSPV